MNDSNLLYWALQLGNLQVTKKLLLIACAYFTCEKKLVGFSIDIEIEQIGQLTLLADMIADRCCKIGINSTTFGMPL